MAMGEKIVETRCWSTKYRGPLAIHSAAKLPAKFLGASARTESFRNELADVLMCRRDSIDAKVRTLPYGSILCIVKLVSIEETEHVREILCQRELIFGNYEDGRYAWFTEMIEIFKPIPVKGNRMLWNWERK